MWEALAEAAARGAQKPKYLNCRHEAVAVAMAAGYTKVTNRPQVVMLHATAGPLNAAMTLRAALQERTPMVIISGEIAAYGENTKVADPGGQWLHDLTDLGGSPGIFGLLKLLWRIRRRRYRSFRLVFIGGKTSHHGTGIGKAALLETIQRLKRYGAEELLCAWVLESNAALIHALRNFGFSAVATFGLYEK